MSKFTIKHVDSQKEPKNPVTIPVFTGEKFQSFNGSDSKTYDIDSPEYRHFFIPTIEYIEFFKFSFNQIISSSQSSISSVKKLDLINQLLIDANIVNDLFDKIPKYIFETHNYTRQPKPQSWFESLFNNPPKPTTHSSIVTISTSFKFRDQIISWKDIYGNINIHKKSLSSSIQHKKNISKPKPVTPVKVPKKVFRKKDPPQEISTQEIVKKNFEISNIKRSLKKKEEEIISLKSDLDTMKSQNEVISDLNSNLERVQEELANRENELSKLKDDLEKSRTINSLRASLNEPID